jgi:hypothetical protein
MTFPTVAPMWRRSAVIASLVLCAACTANGEREMASSGVAASGAHCAATTVHYRPDKDAGAGLAQLPWIAAAPASVHLVGYLFYYDASNVWTKKRLPGLRMFSGGQSPDGRLSMKILWESRDLRAAPPVLGVREMRLDGLGSSSQQLASTSSDAAQFPSIIDIPTPGCWRLTFKAAGTMGQVTVLVVSGTSHERRSSAAGLVMKTLEGGISRHWPTSG